MLSGDVFMCLVKQGIPSDEDLEWLFIRKKLHGYDESVGSKIICFDLIVFLKFVIMQVVLLNIIVGQR